MKTSFVIPELGILFFSTKNIRIPSSRILLELLFTQRKSPLKKFYGLLCKSRTSKSGMTTRELLIAFSLLFASPLSLSAQNNPELIVTLMNRIGELEAEQRNLRGQLDEVHHDLSILQKRMETLLADVDLRFNSPEATDSVTMIGPEPAERESPSSPSQSAEEEYESARTLLEKGDYEAAGKAFTAFINNHSTHELAGAAQYWLGVTYFVRSQYEKAAASFAKLFKTYPKSPKTPDGLLKLAKSLSALERKADACTTLDQLSKDYPKAHHKEIAAEREKLKCK